MWHVGSGLYPSPFRDEVLDKVVGHKIYLFLDGFFGYHQIQIAPGGMDIKWFSDAFVWVVMPFGLKNVSPMYQRVVNKIFKHYLDNFMKLFLDDFTIFSDLDIHLPKLQWCCKKCQEYMISLNLEKCALMVLLGMILEIIISKKRSYRILRSNKWNKQRKYNKTKENKHIIKINK